MEQLTKTKEVSGIVYVQDQKFYVIGVSQICDNDGVDLPAIGWLSTSSEPINADVMLLEPDTTAVYDLPVLVIGGVYVSGLKDTPATIQVLKEFSWEDDEITTDELDNLDKSYETIASVNTITEEN